MVSEEKAAPSELGMDMEMAMDLLEDMTTAEAALRKPLHLPAKARFAKGPAVHVQFDGGA